MKSGKDRTMLHAKNSFLAVYAAAFLSATAIMTTSGRSAEATPGTASSGLTVVASQKYMVALRRQNICFTVKNWHRYWSKRTSYRCGIQYIGRKIYTRTCYRTWIKWRKLEKCAYRAGGPIVNTPPKYRWTRGAVRMDRWRWTGIR